MEKKRKRGIFIVVAHDRFADSNFKYLPKILKCLRASVVRLDLRGMNCA